MTDPSSFSIELEHTGDYQFLVKFDWPEVPNLLLDEPEPLGERKGPNASRLLAAAVSNCLSASLLFCLSKAKLYGGNLKTRTTVDFGRNEKGRIRLNQINVNIILDNAGTDINRYKRCAALFEDFCIVTESVRNGIPVDVNLTVNGQTLLSTK